MPVSRKGETNGRLSRPRTAGYSRRTAPPLHTVEAKEKLVNDRHPSGTATPPAPSPDSASPLYASYDPQSVQQGGYTGYGYDGQSAYGSYSTGTFDADPLFGDLPGEQGGGYDAYAAPQQGMATGTYDTGSYSTGSFPVTDSYGSGGYATGTYDTGSYDTTGAWASTGYQTLSEIPAQPTTGPDVSGQWDANAWNQPDQYGQSDGTGQWQTLDAHSLETQTFEAQQFETQTFETGAFETQAFDAQAYGTQTFEAQSFETSHFETQNFEAQSFDSEAMDGFGEAELPEAELPEDESGEFEAHDYAVDDGYEPDVEEHRPDAGPRRSAAPRSRSRRRSPVKRSALLTVAVPSVCVMGVAGIAAASVSSMSGDNGKETTAAAPDPTAVKPSVANNKLDTQLENLSADAGDFADRASRTQERIDLKARQEADRKKAAEEAARKERLRPKFLLPVTQKGLSAYFGQAGVNWMSVHTGIDFPVSYGTQVMSATDGVLTTKWNSAYGNMAIVTAKDGTETWYCHLSHYKLAPGTTVKAGDVIAFSGNSGNSTGPHLHFEVRPGGGTPIDPLPWLRSHGLDPT
ncbi:M23 family metallopeptidase [Streptomyces sp. NPDC002004]